jgi:hypothetical protein
MSRRARLSLRVALCPEILAGSNVKVCFSDNKKSCCGSQTPTWRRWNGKRGARYWATFELGGCWWFCDDPSSHGGGGRWCRALPPPRQRHETMAFQDIAVLTVGRRSPATTSQVQFWPAQGSARICRGGSGSRWGQTLDLQSTHTWGSCICDATVNRPRPSRGWLECLHGRVG